MNFSSISELLEQLYRNIDKTFTAWIGALPKFTTKIIKFSVNLVEHNFKRYDEMVNVCSKMKGWKSAEFLGNFIYELLITRWKYVELIKVFES